MSDTGTPAAAPAAPAAGANWYDSFDVETKGYLQNRGLDKLKPEEAFLKTAQAHREAEKHLGAPADKLVRMPKDAADAEGWKALSERLGVPADGKYDLTGVKFADGTELDADFVTEMSSVLKNAMVPKDRAADIIKKIVELGDKGEAGEIAARDAQIIAQREALKINWGNNVERNLVVADNAAAKLGITPAELAAAKDSFGAAKVAEMFYKMGVSMGEDKFVSGGANNGGSGNAMSGEMAEARLAQMQNDQAWITKLNAGDTTALLEFDNVTRIASAFRTANKAR